MKPVLAAVIFASSLLQTCTSGLVPVYDPSAGQRIALDQARAGLEARPGTTDPALVFAATVEGLAPTLAVEERGALVEEACLYLDAAAQNEPDRAWTARAAEGTLRRAVGDAAGAEAALRTSLSLKPNLVALPPLVQLLAGNNRASEVATTCAGMRPYVVLPEDIHLLMTTCRGAGDPLAWATPADQQTWQQQEIAIQARAAAYAAQQEAERQALYDSFSSPSSSSSSAPSTSSVSSAPQMASVTLKNNCRDRVRVFFGDKPKYGSGRYSWISSNSVSSYSMQPGDMLWIVDESDNGLSSTSVGAGSTRVEITEHCTGFVIR